jgi:Restriction endonuclease/EVE domain
VDWVFQCNPKRYDLASELEKGIGTDDWSMNQHRELVSPGDRVFFWQTGSNARLLAVGHVDSPVYERESPFGCHCVDIIFDYKIVPPVTRPEMLDQKELSTFAPFKGMMGTNFPVPNPETVVALDKVIEGRLDSLSVTSSPTPAIGDVQIALDAAIKRARHQISLSLRQHVSTMDPIGFEWLVRALLLKLGYADVTVTKPSGDGGVDLRATLVGGGIARIRTCIQVKRQQSVGAPIVQNIRGSLSAHEAGLLVTSGQFTPGAIAEASDPQKLPITLVNGSQLLDLLLKHEIGVEPVHLTHYRLKLDEISKERLEALVEEQSTSGS